MALPSRKKWIAREKNRAEKKRNGFVGARKKNWPDESRKIRREKEQICE